MKDIIVSYYGQHPDPKSIILIGHVPVPFSGMSANDGHGSQQFGGSHIGAWASDLYYGDMDGTWTDQTANTEALIPDQRPNYLENRNVPNDGKFDQNDVPSIVEASVGRIDFARARLRSYPPDPQNEPGLELQIPGGTSMTDAELETALIARYLDRNHAFRVGALQTENQALTDDGFGSYTWEANKDAWWQASTIVGYENTHGRDWLTRLDASQPTGGEDYLLAFGGGSGIRQWPNGALYVTYHDENPYGLYRPSGDFRGVFNFLFGSWFIDFDQPQNALSGVLAVNGKALVVMPHGRPGLPLHRAALGAPIGDLLHTITDPDAFANYEFSYDFEQQPGFVWPNRHVAIQGDPTLQFEVVKSVTNLRAQTLPGTLGRSITWTASADHGTDGFLGHYVYRSVSPDGPLVRVTNDYITGTSYSDAFINIGSHTYMVRAIKKETTPSGTYINASTGVFVQTTGPKVLLPKFNTELDQNVTVKFDRDVSSVLTAGDLALTRVGVDSFGSTVTLTNYNSATDTATFKFSGTFGSILPDGNYRATVIASDVAINDEPMTEDLILDFHVLAGDANADRTVNMTDYNILASNFGQTGKTFSEGNFDYDPAGTVNMADYNILAANFGAVLNPPPTGPGAITASVVSPDQIELTWLDSVSGETGWRVQRSTDGANFDWYQNIPANTQSFTATGLQDGKRYWFRVRAYSDPAGGAGETAYTPKKAGTTLLPAPTNLSVQLAGSYSASLNWSHSAQNALTAVIQRSTDGFTWTNFEQDAINLNYDDNSLNGTTRYYYRVLLKNDLIESAPSYVEYIDTL